MAADPLTSRTVDNLLAEEIDFDFDDDPFADPKPPQNTTRDDKSTLSPRKRKAQDDAFGGNVDEEVKIVKQRVKIPKLDVERLCSKPGIPQIRELVRSGKLKKRLRLKGKGHELTDAARLLNYYQIWLDKLYPRAKFADALQLVEKAGHNKRMQVMRKAWIDESKPGYSRREDADSILDGQKVDDLPANASSKNNEEHDVQEKEGSSLMFLGTDTMEDRERDMTGPDDDELDLLLAQEQDMSTAQQAKTAQEDSEGEDDLDALLAEQETRKSTTRPVVIDDDNEDDEDQDELDALLHEQEIENQQSIRKSAARRTIPADALRPEMEDQGQDQDQDELDMLLNENSQTSVPSTTPTTNTKIVKEFNDDDFSDLDELDALLAQQPNNSEKTEPVLPPMTTTTTTTTTATIKPAPTNTGEEDTAPNSEEVPELELDNMISSSPIPNVRTDELDELMDEHDAKVSNNHSRTHHTPQKPKDDSQLVEDFMSSSPIPNES